MSMNCLARHIIAVAHDNQLSVTNLQLQKVMYFTLKKALVTNILDDEQLQNLYDRPFLVWRYGPVEKEIYEKYRVFGSDPIIEENEQVPELHVLNEFITEELRRNPFDLVNKSHEEEFWQNHESDIVGWRSNIPYTLANIRTGE